MTHKIMHIFIADHYTPKVLEIAELEASTPHAVADDSWTQGMLYGQYVKEGEDTVIKEGIIIRALQNQSSLIIEDIEQLDPRYLKPLLHAVAGRTIDLGVGAMTIGREDATYHVTDRFKLVGLTTLTIDQIEQHFPKEMHQYIKVYQMRNK